MIIFCFLSLKFGKFLVSFTRSSLDFQDVESDGFRQWSTLTNGNDVTFRNSESWGNVSSQVLVSFFVSVVFWNVMQVVSSDDNRSVHLSRNNSTGQNSTSDGDFTSEWTFLVNVRTFNGRFWGLEAQTDIFIPSLGSSGGLGLWVGEDVWLLK